jgi:hypothetical protein
MSLEYEYDPKRQRVFTELDVGKIDGRMIKDESILGYQKLRAGTVSRSRMDTALTPPTTQSIPAGGTFVIPTGWRMVVADHSSVILEVFDGTAWKGVAPPSGLVLSDGTNVRVRNTDAAAAHSIIMR